MSAISFRVYGTPAPQGSKRHVGNGVMVESSAKVRPWRQDVKYAALEALTADCPDCAGGMAGHFDRHEPVTVRVAFYLARPKSHYRTGANAHLLRGSAPKRPASKPDLDKLARSTLDALGEAGVFADDSQVAALFVVKEFADNSPPGAAVTVEAIS